MQNMMIVVLVEAYTSLARDKSPTLRETVVPGRLPGFMTR